MTIIDRPWAIVYGPKCKYGRGLMYGLGLTRRDAWDNAILVWNGGPMNLEQKIATKADLIKRGMIARRVEVHL
jgi:hypothetical protein